MLKEKVSEYLNRKELSKKAVDEIVAILADHNYSSEGMVEELVDALFSLKPDAVYAFVCKQLQIVPAEHLEKFIDLSRKAINPNKFTHAFALSIALCNQKKLMESNVIISHLVQNFVLVKKINKQIYASFERAMHFEGAEKLFEKWVIDDVRAKNGYRKLLEEFLKIYPKAEYVDRVTKWYASNDITICSSEQEVIGAALKKASESADIQEVVNVPTSAKKKGAADLAQTPIPQLLEAVNSQFAQLCKKIDELESENKKLKENAEISEDKRRNAELDLKKAEGSIQLLQDKIKAHEATIDNLNKELAVASGQIKALNSDKEKLNEKLNNVESAYGHAGQQEVEFIKGQIKKRLASEYSKYMELKDKTPDLDYYEILLDMLDEIYHVLSKNGIKFD